MLRKMYGMGKGEDLTCVLCSTFSSIRLLRLSCVSHVRLCATLTLTLTHRWQSTRLPRLWDSPGKNTGVGCHFLLQCMKVKSESEVAQSCSTLSDPMDCSPPGASVHGIFQARVLEWVAIAFSPVSWVDMNQSLSVEVWIFPFVKWGA